jgi:hypothetical protein
MENTFIRLCSAKKKGCGRSHSPSKKIYPFREKMSSTFSQIDTGISSTLSSIYQDLMCRKTNKLYVTTLGHHSNLHLRCKSDGENRWLGRPAWEASGKDVETHTRAEWSRTNLIPFLKDLYLPFTYIYTVNSLLDCYVLNFVFLKRNQAQTIFHPFYFSVK